MTRVGRGKFSLGASKTFIPEISQKIKILKGRLGNEFPFIELCIWNTRIINEFMQHQPGNFQLIIEVNKEAVQSVFYFLKELNYPVFLEPSVDIIEKYVPVDKEAIFIKPLVSEAPLQMVGNIPTITVEKLLVDLFCDVVIFAAQQGAELRVIFNEAFSKYTINQSRMLRYANRRRKKESFREYINTIQIYGSKV